ncbi:hypothetical protein [Streptomyces albireticuli]|uniref:hypothetical protein n=1 Tax=Streptomyces albireticuli TaxID=1940 RepID=UPI00147661A6|nr:hypothetical protein [Streptomyces albireticuli]MCD9195233.1 hypothetical protein [Streptomyces albireticuli]
MNIARPVAIAATAALLGGGLLLAPSATATPATGTGSPSVSSADLLNCSHKWSNKDAGKEKATANGVRYRVGPHTSCSALGQIAKGTTVYLHCYTTTKDDGTWSHVRVKGTDNQGWVKDSLIGGGSLKLC